jgi:hypothetical protein
MSDYFHLDSFHPEGIKAFHIGSVRDVIEGSVDMRLKIRRFSAQKFQYGFEVGSSLNFDAMGEAILVSGKLFSTCTDPMHERYGQLVSGDEFVTNGLFAIPHKTPPSFRLQLGSKKGLPLEQVYQQVYQKVAKPFAFCGWMTFASFHATFIEQSPTKGKNIFKNKNFYYSNPPLFRGKEYGFTKGVVADFNDTLMRDVNASLKTVLYHNPFEKSTQLSSHAHILTLNSFCKTELAISSGHARECLHLFCEQSVITHANLKIFIIESVEDYLE